MWSILIELQPQTGTCFTATFPRKIRSRLLFHGAKFARTAEYDDVDFFFFFVGEVGEGISREEFILLVSDDILNKLPDLYEIWRVRRDFQLAMTPTIVVLLQELERFNNLIKVMKRTLQQLKKALAGEIGMDAILDNVAYSLYNGQLPASWRKLTPATCKNLGGWMEFFLRRHEQYFNWVTYREKRFGES